MSNDSVIIRPARGDDMRAIAAIYKPFVVESMCTFAYENESPSESDMRKRWEDLSAGGFPWLVAEAPIEGEASARIVGYAYVGPFRTRAGWRFTVESSIYLLPGVVRRGLGTLLLTSLLSACRDRGYHVVMAAISVDEGSGLGEASVGLHRKAGFVEAGRIKQAGWKFNKWCDCMFMQLTL